MSVRELPSRVSPLAHTPVPEAPAGVPAAQYSPDKEDFGLPSQRSIWEREFLVTRRSQTMGVSRRENQGARRTNIGHPPVRLVDRIDPFWEITWDDMIGGADWRRASTTKHRLTTDVRGNVVVKSFEAFSPIAMSQQESYGENMMRMMALLFQFGALTSSQLCSFMDLSFRGLSFSLNRMFGLGLVERMTPAWVKVGPSSRMYHGSGDIWRVNLRSETVTTWLDGLSNTDYALMTGGRDAGYMLHNGTFVSEYALRHNLAVAELCLRGLETSPGLAGAWGEPFTEGNKFLSEMLRGSMDVRYVRGDAALVGKDGSVVIVELTAGQDSRDDKHGATLAARAAAWAAIAKMSDVPMSLVVVSIGGYAASRRIAKHLRENTENELAQYFADVGDRKRALDTVHMSSIQSWWPSAGAISRKFLTLEAFSPFTGEYRELLPADAEWDTGSPVVVNTVAALHTPPWSLHPVMPIVNNEEEPTA
ncbi:MAG TPA: hypothetical protein VFC06_06795 [Demequina sp.]|nr:hypothetical protein [Demequina sp.]